MYCKTKKQRQSWWKNLTSEQKEVQISKWQAKKAKKRENQPLRAIEYDSRYPWLTEGVNSKNKAQWLAMIKKKNPWLRIA